MKRAVPSSTQREHSPNSYGKLRWIHSATYKIAASPAGLPLVKKLPKLPQDITHMSFQFYTGVIGILARVISDWSVTTTFSEEGDHMGNTILLTPMVGTSGVGKEDQHGLLLPLSGGRITKSNWILYNIQVNDGLDWKETLDPIVLVLNFYGPDRYEETQYLI